MKRVEFRQEQIDEIIRLYTQEKWGMYKIAQHMGGYSRGVIQRTLKENNIEIDTPGQRYRGGKEASVKRYHSKPEVIERKRKNHKKWREKNKEHLKEYHKQWREDNRESLNEYKRIYEKTKKDSDPSYKLACYTRTAIYTCLKERNIDKYKNTFDYLPYTLEDLIEHLQSQFQEGMTWDNYGEWHVDHIKPMVSFNISSPEDKEFKECWSLNNLQPLWGEENLSKGSTYL
jgi:hypothetical protein